MKENKKFVNKAINNIIKEGITDVDLFLPFYEIKILEDENQKNELIEKYTKMLFEQDFENIPFSKINYFLFPKNDFTSYRKCALIQIVDEIKYLSLVLSIAKEIENARLQKSKNLIFSYRYIGNKESYLFDEKYNYQSFRNEIGKIISKNKYQVMICCDISNYYDRINIHRLISKLYTISTKKEVIEKIEKLLLFWANRNSYSLPVGSNASRILAEAALIDVDKYLYDNSIKFIRFVDDFRIFCTDVVEAQKVLNMLINRLDMEGLYLNSKKTKLVDLTKEGDRFHIIVKNNSELSEDERREKLKIIRGYNGTIPTKFKKLSSSEIEKYSSYNADEQYLCMQKKSILESNDVIYLIKVLIANKRYDLFLQMCPIMKKYPQLIPYYISAFSKNKAEISDEEGINNMKKDYLSILSNYNEYPVFILIYITRLFEDDYCYKNTIFDIYMKSPKNINPYFGRRLLEVLESKLERYQLLELKEMIQSVSLWEKREIIKCLYKGLYEDEFKPIYKDYLIAKYDELFWFNNKFNF